MRVVLQAIPEAKRDRLAVHFGRPDLRFSLMQLKQFGFVPASVLDGGAYHGDWARTCLEIWPTANVLCIEPQANAQTYLQRLATEKQPQLKVMQGLLGSSVRDAVPFNDSGTGSSVLHSHDAKSSYPMWTIDSLAERSSTAFDLVKLDLQGLELEALAGFERNMQHCTILQLELSLLPLISGAPLIAEVLAYLNERGFVIYDVDELIRSPSDGAVWQIDALFCKKDSDLRTARKWRT